jgi:hypothetical protein
MSRVPCLLLPLLCLALGGCRRDTAFLPESVISLTLYSIECDFDSASLPDDAELLHGYLVLGKAEISSSERSEVIDAIRADIANGSKIYNCFDPHHAVRLVTEDKTLDIVICYKCRGYERSENGKLVTTSFPMDVRSRGVLNRILRSKGIELSPAASAELTH